MNSGKFTRITSPTRVKPSSAQKFRYRLIFYLRCKNVFIFIPWLDGPRNECSQAPWHRKCILHNENKHCLGFWTDVHLNFISIQAANDWYCRISSRPASSVTHERGYVRRGCTVFWVQEIKSTNIAQAFYLWDKVICYLANTFNLIRGT